MSSYPDLSNYAKNADSVGFLRTYMRLVVEGKSLALPSFIDLDSAREGWLEILTSTIQEFDLKFVDKLARFWIEVVKKQGGMMHENFATDVLNILYSKPKQVSPTPPTAHPPQHVQSHGQTDTFTPSLSQLELSQWAASLDPPPNRAEIQMSIEQAIKANNTDLFLVHYLSYIRYGIKPTLPLSTLEYVIELKWEEIILREFGLQPSPVFFAKLTTRWFYLMHLKGLPSTEEKIWALYRDEYTRCLSLKGPSEKPRKKPKGFWSKWFGFLQAPS